MRLFLDIETRSTCDLRKCGAYVYAEHPATEILMIAYATDNEPVRVWLTGEDMPLDLEIAFGDRTTDFVAHNSQFERILLSGPAGRRIGVPDLSDISRWTCTAAEAAAFCLPRTLEGAAAALGLPVEKDKDGHRLMLQMCKPRKPRKGEPTDRVLWHETPEQIARLAAYCAQDVEVERAIFHRLPRLSAIERQVWELTERMNDRGMPVDVRLLGAMIHIIDEAEVRVDRSISARTDGVVPRVSDHMALTRWLASQGIDDAEETGVGKAAVAALIENSEIDPLIREVLLLRQSGGGVSPKKWRAILARISDDGMIRGSLVYCGAASTGRYSSRGAQLQNLPRGGSIKDPLGAVRDILDGATVDEIEFLHGPPLVVASELLRPAFKAPADQWIARGDYSQIEARVNPWLAGAAWKLDMFRAYDAGTGPDNYRVAAAGVFGIPVADVTKDQRQVGKVAELALGFQGGKAAFAKMARGYGVTVTPERAEEIKVAWRETNQAIVRFWYGLNDAAIECMRRPSGKYVPVVGTPIAFKRNSVVLAMRLPSGRHLFYWSPRIIEQPTPWGFRPAVLYRAEDAVTKRWTETVGYGGMFCENAVQATARDVMTHALVELRLAGLDPRLTVHDEIIALLPRDRYPTAEQAAEAVRAIMVQTPTWAAGLPVAADASAAERYIKGD